MKKRHMVVLIIFLMIAPVRRVAAQGPISFIIQQAITKVIKAVDLKIQRLQNRTIWLQNAQKVMENSMSKLKLDEITDWVERQRVLYKDYFEELQKVKAVIASYHKVKDITELQVALAKQYAKSLNGIKNDPHFTREEVVYMKGVYTGIVEESLQNLDGLGLVLNSFVTQMTDEKRLAIIDGVKDRMQKNYDDLRAFTTQNIRLSMARAKDAREIAIIKNLYGVQ